MTAKAKPRKSWLTVLLLIAAIATWAYQETRQQPQTDRRTHSSAGATAQSASKEHQRVGGYEVYQNCSLVDTRNNDGDSFVVRLSDGRQAEFRLYFVDTPESAFKRYASGETNHERIRQQAMDLGQITPEQAVEIGKKGKSFTLSLLESHPFRIYTRWDSPFRDNRFHAFVETNEDGKTRLLDEQLIERGLARIKTKPADLPNGTPAPKQLAHLKELERIAKRAKTGVWGL